MSRVALTPEVYRRAKSIFAAHPGNHARVSRELGVSIDVSKRLWAGPAYKEPEMARLYPIPIRDELDQEAKEATALARRQLEEERLAHDRAELQREQGIAHDERAERIKQRAEEQVMLQATRGVARSLLSTFADLAPTIKLMSTVFRTKVEEKVKQGALTAEEALAGLKDVGIYAEKAGRLVISLEEAGRASRGEPTQVVGITPLPPQRGYVAALDEAKQLVEAMALAERTGHLVVEAEGESSDPAQG